MAGADAVWLRRAGGDAQEASLGEGVRCRVLELELLHEKIDAVRETVDAVRETVDALPMLLKQMFGRGKPRGTRGSGRGATNAADAVNEEWSCSRSSWTAGT